MTVSGVRESSCPPVPQDSQALTSPDKIGVFLPRLEEENTSSISLKRKNISPHKKNLKAPRHSFRDYLDEISTLRGAGKGWREIAGFLQKEKGLEIDQRHLNSAYNAFQRKKRQKLSPDVEKPSSLSPALKDTTGVAPTLEDEGAFSDWSADKNDIGELFCDDGRGISPLLDSTEKVVEYWDDYFAKEKK